jgi:hypothetical protein
MATLSTTKTKYVYNMRATSKVFNRREIVLNGNKGNANEWENS